MEGIIDKENERVRRFFALLDDMEKKVERLARDNRPPFNGGTVPDRQGAFRDVEDQPQVPAGLQGPRTDSLYPAWREDPVLAVGHREAAGGELSPCIGIISYLSLRIVAGIAFTIPAAVFI